MAFGEKTQTAESASDESPTLGSHCWQYDVRASNAVSGLETSEWIA